MERKTHKKAIEELSYYPIELTLYQLVNGLRLYRPELGELGLSLELLLRCRGVDHTDNEYLNRYH